LEHIIKINFLSTQVQSIFYFSLRLIVLSSN